MLLAPSLVTLLIVLLLPPAVVVAMFIVSLYAYVL